MSKKNETSAKLDLKRETLRELSTAELTDVAGGKPKVFYPTTKTPTQTK